MDTLQNAPVSNQTFTQFLFHNRRSRIMLYLAAAAIIIQFIIFKYLYPFASYIHDDSFTYLTAASQNLTINKYPIGYSKFLRLVSVFAKPELLLVGLQYLLIQCSVLFLLFTIFYFCKAGRATQIILLCFMVFNPLFLHMANMISSDALFLALSITWFALLCWIMYKPSNKIIGWHAVVLFLAFTVRYNALIYPFIAALAFWLSNISFRKKVLGLGLALLLFGWFVGLSMFQYKKLTGYWQYSPFSGWLLANNAMYAYQEVPSADREPVPAKFIALDNAIRTFYDTSPYVETEEASTAYMWTPQFPLWQYPDSLFKKEAAANQFKIWAGMGPFYSAYGWYIIKTYPMHFLRYFIWPNSKKYLAPPVEFLEEYNSGRSTIKEPAITWFGYSSNQVKTTMNSSKVWVLQYYPLLISITNVFMLLGLSSYLLLKGWQFKPIFFKSILLAGFSCLTYAVFTIFTCSAALRFQAFPVLLTVTFSLLLIDWTAQLMQHMKTQSQQLQPDSQYSQNVSV